MNLATHSKKQDVLRGLRWGLGETWFSKEGKLSEGDKLTLSGVVSLLTIFMLVGGGFLAMENRYATRDDMRALRCDIMMFQITDLNMQRNQTRQALSPMMKETLNQMERRWDRMCIGGD